ncbi:MAG: hypothetical protein AAF908_09125, partial [Pseudomonadota bacterium]
MTGQRLTALSTGFFRQKRLRRMLELAGWDLHFGWPGRGPVAVWGRKPAARRVLALARLAGADVLHGQD